MGKLKYAAIASIDPGGTTGVAMGIYNLHRTDGTVAEIMDRARLKNQITTFTTKGHHVVQALEIAGRVGVFVGQANKMATRLNGRFGTFVVIEDFNLRMMSAELSPVEVTAAFDLLVTAEFGVHPENFGDNGFYTKQSASEAKGFCNDRMLRKWKLFQGRTAHERDALRHTARRLDRLLVSNG